MTGARNGDAAPVHGACTGAAPTATLDLWPHPLTAEGRATTTALAIPPEGASLADVVRRALPGAGGLDAPVAAAVDGRFVAAADWAAVRLTGGEIVTLRAALRGGGDSDPLRVILTIAVIAASFYVPGALGFAAGSWQAGLVSAFIQIAGGVLINALVPPQLPEEPETAEREPTYSLSGGANRARLYQPLLLVLGRHRVFPDLTAREYTELQGEDQYLSQIFDLGIGDLHVSDVRLGGTPIDDYDDIESEEKLAGTVAVAGEQADRDAAAVRLVQGNVDTIAGAALEDDDWVVRTAPEDSRRLVVEIVGELLRVDDRGNEKATPKTVQTQLRRGNGAWTMAVDTELGTEPGPVRATIVVGQAPIVGDSILAGSGDYEVRVRRTSEPSDALRRRDDLTWSALRAYQPDRGDYSGRNRIAYRIRASGQLSGRLDRVSAMVSQKVPTWNGAWTQPEATSNPAWIFRQYALGWTIGGRVVAGVGLPASRLDDAAVRAWGSWCDAQTPALRCDMALDRVQSHARVLQAVAKCGRATPTWQTGKLGVVWEAADVAATALVTPGNIVAGSFEVDWVAGEPAEEIVVRYIEPDLDWQWNTVRRLAPGVATPRHSATLTLAGVTGREQAALECNLQAARQVYHRRRLKWEMGPEGLTIARGDVVHITHGMIDGGTAGRLERIEDSAAGGAARDVLTLDRETGVEAADRLLLRLPDGAVHDSALASVWGGGPHGERPRLATPLPLSALDGPPMDVLWRLYAADAPPVRVRVVATEPQADGRVRFEAIDEVAEYYAAATSDLTVALPSAHAAAPRIVDVRITERAIRAGAGHAVELTAWLTVAGDWRGGAVRAAHDGGAARTVARMSGGDTEASWIAPASGTLEIQVYAGSESAPIGAAVEATYEIGSGVLSVVHALTAVTGFAVGERVAGLRRYTWDTHPRDDTIGYEVRYGEATDAWDDMTALGGGLIGGSPWEHTDPGSGTWRFGIAAHTGDGAVSPPAYVDATLGDVAAGVDGEDGQGWEYVFAATAGASVPSSQRPSNSWGYDSPGTRGGLTWHDGAPALSAAKPYLWRCARRVSGAPAGGAAVSANWSAPVIVGRYGADGTDGIDGVDGIDGIDGGDGRAYEYIFARTEDTVPAESQRPSNSWGYDEPGTRDGLEWHDAAPDLTSTYRTLWRCERQIEGVPAVGDAVSDNWSTPVSVGRFGLDAGDGVGGGLYYVWDTTGVRFRPGPSGKVTGYVRYPSSTPTPPPSQPGWR